jgi:hypothetical protein
MQFKPCNTGAGLTSPILSAIDPAGANAPLFSTGTPSAANAVVAYSRLRSVEQYSGFTGGQRMMNY